MLWATELYSYIQYIWSVFKSKYMFSILNGDSSNISSCIHEVVSRVSTWDVVDYPRKKYFSFNIVDYYYGCFRWFHPVQSSQAQSL